MKLSGTIAAVNLLFGLWGGPVVADAIERNLPAGQEQEGVSANVIPPNAVPQDLDEVPLGPNVSGIVVIGRKDSVVTQPAAGIDVSRVADLNDAASSEQLKAYLGKPLTRRLMAEVEATIANIYRAKGLPFVAVLTPQQEVTTGVVQFRVVDFTLGKITVTGNSRTPASMYSDALRVKPGERIESGTLLEDLDRLNSSNFHKAEAVFTPGERVAQTDLNLRVTEGKPWRVYAGYSNSGAPSTTRGRYFIGGIVGDLVVPGSYLAYQATGSGDYWVHDGGVLKAHPKYVSHAARLVVPTAPRQDIEATFSWVESNKAISVFNVRQAAFEGSIAYRSAMSNFSNLGGEVYGGFEFAHQTSNTFFFGTSVFHPQLDVYQAFVGWSGGLSSPLGQTLLDTSLHFSPGGISNHNDSSYFANYSGGRATDSHYYYIDAAVTHRYAVAPGFNFVTMIQGQLTTDPLPETDQMSVDYVRGYTPDDGSYDAGIMARSELSFPFFKLADIHDNLQQTLSPHIFVDGGYLRNHHDGSSARPLSVGAGFNYKLSRFFTSTMDVAVAAHDAGRTESGDVTLEARVVFTY